MKAVALPGGRFGGVLGLLCCRERPECTRSAAGAATALHLMQPAPHPHPSHPTGQPAKRPWRLMGPPPPSPPMLQLPSTATRLLLRSWWSMAATWICRARTAPQRCTMQVGEASCGGGGAVAVAWVGRLLWQLGGGMGGVAAGRARRRHAGVWHQHRKPRGARAHAASSCLGSRQRRQHACKVVPLMQLKFNFPLLLRRLCAASGGHIRVVSSLLAANADCDVQNSNGNTPLHLAACKGGR